MHKAEPATASRLMLKHLHCMIARVMAGGALCLCADAVTAEQAML